jgi:PHD/YefM family antitoxin component YafN of YafNO toxin-antitoxin module
MKEYTSQKAKANLDALIRQVNLADKDPVIITNPKGQQAALISLDRLEDMNATLSALAALDRDEIQLMASMLSPPEKTADSMVASLNPGFRQVYQFKVTLAGIRPPIWRRVQVPDNYSLWDLHIAIQDAMGWMDCHMHEFEILNPATQAMERIGIPADELDWGEQTVAGWTRKMAATFGPDNPKATYRYDFGDNWVHSVTLEKILLRVKDRSYPVCLGGKRACPPEDCGGIGGYEELLQILADPDHAEHHAMLDWLGEPFDAEAFDPAALEFTNPRQRWQEAFGDLEKGR